MRTAIVVASRATDARVAESGIERIERVLDDLERAVDEAWNGVGA